MKKIYGLFVMFAVLVMAQAAQAEEILTTITTAVTTQTGLLVTLMAAAILVPLGFLGFNIGKKVIAKCR